MNIKVYIFYLFIITMVGCNISGEGNITINNGPSSSQNTPNIDSDNSIDNNPDGSTNGNNNSTTDPAGLYKRIITTSNTTSTTEIDTTFRIQIDSQVLISSGKMKNDCSDIRVFEGENQLSTWIGEDSCNTTETDIYFKIPSFSPGNISIDLFYGDLNLNSVHSGEETFPIFFDDFNRADLFTKINSSGDSYTITLNDGTVVSGMGNYYYDWR